MDGQGLNSVRPLTSPGEINIFNELRRRIPGWAQVLPVYGVIVIMVYAWTLLWFFWRVPGWLYYLNVAEILTALAYELASNLAESLLVLCAPLLLALVLPGKWFRDVFVARGAALCIAALGYMMLLAYQFNNKDSYPGAFLKPSTLVLVLIGIGALVYLCGRIPPVRRLLEVLADRLSIFAYILVPLSMLSTLVVIVRVLIG